MVLKYYSRVYGMVLTRAQTEYLLICSMISHEYIDNSAWDLINIISCQIKVISGIVFYNNIIPKDACFKELIKFFSLEKLASKD